ncbi:hypothetical protein P4O66_004169 [Electrophorus voltai]|uniref:Uncharacterized protein n=1 Tax=Electrophorus voltai TaxID=2609070 RepID=A0AAD8ZPF7_9TELE|nr:hypothetical protein P4O66_004169 [Electrophorus voltai]
MSRPLVQPELWESLETQWGSPQIRTVSAQPLEEEEEEEEGGRRKESQAQSYSGSCVQLHPLTPGYHHQVNRMEVALRFLHMRVASRCAVSDAIGMLSPGGPACLEESTDHPGSTRSPRMYPCSEQFSRSFRDDRTEGENRLPWQQDHRHLAVHRGSGRHGGKMVHMPALDVLGRGGGVEGGERPRGKRAGIRNRLRAPARRAPLPSILLANVQSLDNRLDDLRARIHFQRDIWDCNLLCFTELWLNPAVPSQDIQPAEFYSVHCMDRMADSGKSRGGGVCVTVNNSWCNNANVVTLARSCSPNLELLTLKLRPFYLPQEFTSVIINTMYIPPQANMDTALCELHKALTQFQAEHHCGWGF